MALTKRQKQVLDFLAEFIENNGYSPSYEEIASALQLASLATVHKHISALEAKNYVKRSFNQSRSLEVSPKYVAEYRRQRQTAAPAAELPLLGRIAAGVPVETYESQEKLSFADLTGSSDAFALEVRGNSMIEDHICSGDYVLVQKANDVRDGEIVVALVDGAETTLKRLYREGGHIRLQPANETMPPIYVNENDVMIQGIVVGVMRRY